MEMTLHERLVAFRLASRQLFNGFFRHPTRTPAAWEDEERFSNVEEELFKMLVADPEGIYDVSYPEVRPEILVRFQVSIPTKRWLVNHNSSWEWEEFICPAEAELHFHSFFDWDEIGVKDYQYVRITVAEPSDLAGIEALIEFQHIEFVRRGAAHEA